MGCRYRPLSVNKYIYGEADPVSNIDPSGKSIFSMTAVTGVMGTLSTTAFVKAATYTTAILGATAVAIDIADRNVNILWALSESTAPNIKTEGDRVAYEGNRREYKNRCGEQWPGGGSQCDKWKWELQRNKDCADMREAFGKKWFNDFDGGHQQAIDDMRKAITKLEKKIERRCK